MTIYISIGDDIHCEAPLRHDFNIYICEKLDCNLGFQSITTGIALIVLKHDVQYLNYFHPILHN